MSDINDNFFFLTKINDSSYVINIDNEVDLCDLTDEDLMEIGYQAYSNLTTEK